MNSDLNITQALLRTAEDLLSLLISRATGGEADNEEYKILRKGLMTNILTQDYVPRIVATSRDTSQFWNVIKNKYATYAERRVFLQEEFEPLLSKLEGANHSPADNDISTALENFDANYVHRIWNKALERRDTDPDGAITSARTLLESVCKHILDDFGVEYSGTDDLPKLYKQTATQLNLSPDQHTEQLFKQILSGCHSVVAGLGAIRNRFSDAHGQGKKQITPAARHGELAVNLAGSMALFLVRTWEFKKSQS